MAKSLCTDKEYWDYLDKEEEKDRHLRLRLAQLACGRICKRTLAQIYFQARCSSSPENACRNVLYFELKDLTKKEKKAFLRGFLLAKSWFDQQVIDKLLNHYSFHQNAKVITEFLRMIGENTSEKLTEYHEIVTSNPEKEYKLDGTD